MAKSVNKTIVDAVPEYAKMAQDYKNATDLITDLKRELSLNDKAAVSTTLNKLKGAMRNDDALKQELIAELEKAGLKDISGAIAGLAMRPLTSKRMGSMITYAGAGLAGAVAHNPLLLGAAAAASPRAVAELSLLAGQAGRGIAKAKPLNMPAVQGGRLEQEKKKRGLE
jgi:hypothetical protein